MADESEKDYRKCKQRCDPHKKGKCPTKHRFILRFKGSLFGKGGSDIINPAELRDRSSLGFLGRQSLAPKLNGQFFQVGARFTNDAPASESPRRETRLKFAAILFYWR